MVGELEEDMQIWESFQSVAALHVFRGVVVILFAVTDERQGEASRGRLFFPLFSPFLLSLKLSLLDRKEVYRLYKSK